MNASAQGRPGISFADVDLDGNAQRLEYAWIDADHAEAPLLVFLHEGLGSVSMWKDFPRLLCTAARVRGLVYSRPGYGRSTPRPPAEKWPVRFLHDQAQKVLPALLDKLGIDDETWLLGHSDGGSIALLCAAAFPQRVAGVIALAPHVFVESLSVASIEVARIAYGAGDLRQRLARHHDDPDSAFHGWNDIWLDPAFLAWNIEDCLSRIRCPVLAVQGEQDPYGTMAQVDTIARHVPQAKLLKLPNCGHSPHRDQRVAVVEATVAYLREHATSRIPVDIRR